MCGSLCLCFSATPTREQPQFTTFGGFPLQKWSVSPPPELQTQVYQSGVKTKHVPKRGSYINTEPDRGSLLSGSITCPCSFQAKGWHKHGSTCDPHLGYAWTEEAAGWAKHRFQADRPKNGEAKRRHGFKQVQALSPTLLLPSLLGS